jgi:hypothetical protein
MKPFEEAKYFKSLFKQMDNKQRLDLVARIRGKAISVLAPITESDTDLKNYDHAIIFCLTELKNPKNTPFQNAINLLHLCTHALESGVIDQDRFEDIRILYAGLDKRLIADEIGRVNRSKNFDDKKAEFKKIGSEILTKRKHKPSRSQLVCLIAKRLNPKITDEKLKKMANSRSKINSGWLPGDN